MPDDGSRKKREHLLLEHGLNLHTQHLRLGPLSPNLLAALRLAAGDEEYLDRVARGRASPFQVLAPPC